MSSRKLFIALSLNVASVCLTCGLSQAQAPTPEAPRKVTELSTAERLKVLKIFVEEFVEITPGEGRFPTSFTMGAADGPATERPMHAVTFTSGFAIAKYEVPQNLYAAVIGNNPSRWGGPRNSAEMYSWKQAVQFCDRVTQLLKEANLIGKDEFIRLPSEAEWEYCCRAGTTSAYSFGEKATAPGDADKKASLLNAYGWHTGNAAGNDPPVGALKPNPWGLYDMHGYLWEFTADTWHENYDGAPLDGRAWSDGDPNALRTLRGGSWRDPFALLRCATRRSLSADAKSEAVGMRCVKAKRT